MPGKAFVAAAGVLAGAALFLAPAAGATTVHHPKVGITANHRTIYVGSSVTMTGTVAPNERGHRVYLQQYYGHAWHNRTSGKLSSTSHYKLSAKPSSTGTYTYRVYDPKAAGWAAAASKSVAVTVKRKASCHPLTNSGKCYEPGQFCRSSDHGRTGVAGNGTAIVCKNKNGWRWEPR